MDQEKVTQITPWIFPHTSVPENTLKAILYFFESVKIGRPWFMDQPLPLSQGEIMRIVYPPDELKPTGDFKKLLEEYHGWIRANHGKGADAFLSFKDQTSHGEEATWEIRRDLRQRTDRSEVDRRRNALKWNLLLHLAYEIHEQSSEAEKLLKSLKQVDSPLKGLIEEEEPPRPLFDLAEAEGSPLLSEAGISQVLEAWFSLFESHLSGHEILLTFSQGIFRYLFDTWAEWGDGLTEEIPLGDRMVLKRFPRLKQARANVIVRHLSGKTIGMIRNDLDGT